MSKRKLINTDENPNHDFCEVLNELSVFERTVENNTFKANAYKKAASAISKHPTKLTNMQEAMQIPGVGKQIGLKLEEFLKTGTLEKLNKIKKDDNAAAITELTRVSGIGPTNARKLVTENNIKTLEDLKKNAHLLNHHQKIGLEYLDEFEERIPRSEMLKWNDKLLKYILKVDIKFSAELCGSFRRGAETCGDIDILVTHPLSTAGSPSKKSDPFLNQIVEQLKNDGFITDVLALGGSKLAAVCKLPDENGEVFKHRRLDIRVLPKGQYYFALLYFTGSDLFNKTMRAHALEQGFTLNEYSIRPIGSTGVAGEPIPVTSEQEIFEIINYPFKSPKERAA
ncbi:DNA polymerase beta-like [Symsagittifera roscoffensis]|uniref:DNA polymerase beta-like n=1 Tax=Symsagittifera roscoffensis TaxID=84072 RepID=UPI00307C11AD